MEPSWLKSAAARRVLVHFADARPAWLWSGDGGRLLWRNAAARLFGARFKKAGLRLLPDPVPIKGQVARLVRLGTNERSSLSRVQFLAGNKPLSATCSVTPLSIESETQTLLIVGVDPIDADVRAAASLDGPDAVPEALFPPGVQHLVTDSDGRVVAGSQPARNRFSQRIEKEGVPDEGMWGGGAEIAARLKASPDGHVLLVLTNVVPEAEAPPTIAEIRAEEGVGTTGPATGAAEPAGENERPRADLAPDVHATATPLEGDGRPDGEPEKMPSLSSLFDRLADNTSLFGELTAEDEKFVPPEPPLSEAAGAQEDATAVAQEKEQPTGDAFASAAPADATPAKPEAAAEPDDVVEVLDHPEAVGQEPVAPGPGEPDVIAAVIAFEDDLQDEPHPLQYRITGRGFTPVDLDAEFPPPDPAPAEPDKAAPAGAMDRASRYNFDELGRILADRVGAEVPAAEAPPEAGAPTEPSRRQAAVTEGALINIAAETFILNRLPLGIMVFRDQQVLFANRSLADLLGFPTIDSLREAGLGAIFPGDDAQSAGPVTHLVHRDGTRCPVTARLQSITWQGRPALMLSASPLPPAASQEDAIRGFAELVADVLGAGFFLAERNGTMLAMSAAGRTMLGRDPEQTPLAGLVHPDDAAALRAFLERPARFAEAARPAVRLRAADGKAAVVLFAEGSAGIVRGYFGFLVPPSAFPEALAAPEGAVDPSMLARISRGVRRPLNTIVGFADLIRSAAFGAIENHRYLEYARDIRTAGQEIAVLVDELDDYARLSAGSYPTRPTELDLAAMLESCVVRVRGQAAAARVLVRSAISERLPHIRADRASLGQAVLNLLASAIDQSPPGGSVILSAQFEEEGHVAVNVRDSGEAPIDPGERFVVFRDGIGKDGEPLSPVRSGVGLALTRSLVAVNGCALTVSPAGPVGTLFSLTVPADLVVVSATG